MLVKYGVATTHLFFAADPTDMTAAVTGINTADVTILKINSFVASPYTQSATITSIGQGWYKFTVTLTELGEHAWIISHSTGAFVPWRSTFQVVSALPGEVSDTMIDKIVASIFREPMTTIEGSSYGDTITTTNLSLYKAVMAIVGKVALINSGTTKRIYKTDESSTALDLTLTSGAAPANPIIAQEP